MKKLRLERTDVVTFREGCERYLNDCRTRTLREGTIGHYRQSYVQFYKYFDPEMPLSDFCEKDYQNYILHLKSSISNDQSINSYLRDLITTIHFWNKEGWVKPFKMSAIKVDKHQVETYSESELKALLKKPNIKKCNFTEYQCWVMTAFLFSTGVRQRSLHYIKIKDVDFENEVVYVNVTKNRKPLIVPMNPLLVKIMTEYLKRRPYESEDEFLFVNAFGNQLCNVIATADDDISIWNCIRIVAGRTTQTDYNTVSLYRKVGIQIVNFNGGVPVGVGFIYPYPAGTEFANGSTLDFELYRAGRRLVFSLNGTKVIDYTLTEEEDLAAKENHNIIGFQSTNADYTISDLKVYVLKDAAPEPTDEPTTMPTDEPATAPTDEPATTPAHTADNPKTGDSFTAAALVAAAVFTIVSIFVLTKKKAAQNE